MREQCRFQESGGRKSIFWVVNYDAVRSRFSAVINALANFSSLVTATCTPKLQRCPFSTIAMTQLTFIQDNSAVSLDQLKTVEEALDSLSPALRTLSLDIHSHPEIAWKEKHAHDVLCAFMEKRGFEVTRSAYGIETAWEAVFEQGKGGKTVGFQSEMVR
jgi:hypothetical protein